MHAGHCEQVVHHERAEQRHKSKRVSRCELLGLCWFAIKSRNTETVRRTDVMDLMFRWVFFYPPPFLGQMNSLYDAVNSWLSAIIYCNAAARVTV